MIYTSIHIIYNPVSTGSSRDDAYELKHQLQNLYPSTDIKLQRTKYAGHSELIAYKCAMSSSRPLIISSSGDGGYNEVINGAIKAQLEGARPVCAVLPAGNANDHSRTLQGAPLIEAIKSGNVRSVDLLKASFKKDSNEYIRYAHSYIGLGLTPVVAVELNKTNLNALKELWIVLRTFYKFRPFRINVAGKEVTLDSILFTNISQMAKVLTVAKNAKPDDGIFEVIMFPHSHKFRLIRRLAKATLTGLEPKKQFNNYAFTVLKKMPAQFDGEVIFIDNNSIVQINSERRILTTIL